MINEILKLRRRGYLSPGRMHPLIFGKLGDTKRKFFWTGPTSAQTQNSNSFVRDIDRRIWSEWPEQRKLHTNKWAHRRPWLDLSREFDFRKFHKFQHGCRPFEVERPKQTSRTHAFKAPIRTTKKLNPEFTLSVMKLYNTLNLKHNLQIPQLLENWFNGQSQ